MIHGDSVESTAVSCVTLGSHAGHVYRPANSADPHLKRREREMNFSQRSFKFGVPNPRWLTKQEPVSSKHSYSAMCLLFQQKNTGQLYFLQTGERYHRMRVKHLCEPRNLFPAIGLVASPAETCHQHKHFG